MTDCKFQVIAVLFTIRWQC